MSGARDITICSNRQTGKKRDTDCAVRIVYTDADVACPYDDVADLNGRGTTTDVVGDVAFIYWQILGESVCNTWQLLGKWHGATWPSHGLPRGTIELIVVQNFVWSTGFDLRTSPIVQSLGNSHATNAPTRCFLHYNVFIFI
jgi:hypothetical protein